jgi:hypothetical protein
MALWERRLYEGLLSGHNETALDPWPEDSKERW